VTRFSAVRRHPGATEGSSVADPVAIVDVNALRRRAAGLGTLVEVSGALAATLDLDAVLQATTDGVCRLAGFGTAAVYLLDGELVRVGATTPPLPPEFPEHLRLARLADHPHIRRCIDSGSPLVVADWAAAQLSDAERLVAEHRGLRAMLFAPLIAGVKRVGVLIVSDTTAARSLSDDEVDLCRTLANLAALAVENARLFREAREHAVALERQSAETRRADAERLELERQLLHAQKLESLGILAGGIAHDFNNLLHAVLGNLEVAVPELPAGSAGRDAAEQAAHAARRATDLTRQLLAYSGKGRFVVQPVDVSALVRENANLFRASVPRTCAIELRLAPDLPPVQADVGQIQQVAMNLLTNAADAIGEKCGTVTVATSLRPGGPGALAGSRISGVEPASSYVALEVTDTGCGMTEETVARIFDPFFSTKGAGRGLGLSAILGIVRAHGGGLFVDSAPGRGSTVRILLPAAEAAVAPAPEVARPKPPALERGTVLVVDDEPSVRLACQAMLRSLRMPVLSAGSGAEALEVLRGHRGEVRFVILDVSMPEMDGRATLEALLAVDPSLRIVLSSGFDEQGLMSGSIAARAAGFIQKPYAVAQLRDALARAAQG
jgi:signal transduction histidine kinase/CheY-like chemotaxis protein